MRMSYMMRWPVIWSTHVCRYSSANDASRMARNAERDGIEAGEVADRDVAVDRHLHEVRLRQLEDRGADDRRQRDDHLQPIGPQITKQPPHQDGVVGLTEDFFVVDRHQLAANSSSSS